MPQAFSTPGVYRVEKDLSNVVRPLGTSTGAMVGVANRGKVGEPYLLTSKTNWRSEFGRRDATVSYAHFCAERFLEDAQRLWFVRVDLWFVGFRITS